MMKYCVAHIIFELCYVGVPHAVTLFGRTEYRIFKQAV